ncbi:hypothetical protein VUR80DRAFT_266 [Thermomyces stellatus]
MHVDRGPGGGRWVWATATLVPRSPPGPLMPLLLAGLSGIDKPYDPCVSPRAFPPGPHSARHRGAIWTPGLKNSPERCMPAERWCSKPGAESETTALSIRDRSRTRSGSPRFPHPGSLASGVSMKLQSARIYDYSSPFSRHRIPFSTSRRSLFQSFVSFPSTAGPWGLVTVRSPEPTSTPDPAGGKRQGMPEKPKATGQPGSPGLQWRSSHLPNSRR